MSIFYTLSQVFYASNFKTITSFILLTFRDANSMCYDYAATIKP